ncbi:MAG: peptidyl-prolyl cis-trans isomerase [Deltaproteobacteria bacterium]|nr:peptidyl-prolyl cis-trans isomerase [Deltaproteobacteria bacterium]
MNLTAFLFGVLFPYLVVIVGPGGNLDISEDQEIIARTLDGEVYRGELDRFLACHGAQSFVSHGDLVDGVVVERFLRSYFRQASLREDSEFEAQQRFLALELAALHLRRATVASAAPSQAELLTYSRDHRNDFRQPKRWRLSNLFKRFPEGAGEKEKDVLRRRMTALRQRLLAGESFADLVASESESATRVRGGRMGIVSLKELSPEVAAAVAELEEGDLSAILETAAGLTLVYCAEVLEASNPGPVEVRKRHERILRKKRFRAQWKILEESLVAEFEPRFHAPESWGAASREAPSDETSMVNGVSESGDPAAASPPLVTWKAHSSLPAKPPALHLSDFEFFLRRRGAKASHQLSAHRRQDLLEERWMLELYAFEAERRGLLRKTEYLEQLACKVEKLETEFALNRVSRKYFVEPKESEIRQAVEGNSSEFQLLGKVWLRMIELPIESEKPREFYEQVRELGEKTADGVLSLEQVHGLLEPFGKLEDLGWLSLDQVWLMGRGVQAAVESLEPGEISQAVQEGRRFLYLQLVDRELARPLSREEATAKVAVLLRRQRQRQAEVLARKAILEQLRVEYPSDVSPQ